MPFLPNSADATYPAQAAPQSGDFEAIIAGENQYGVVSGCGVTDGASGMQLAVAGGVTLHAGRRVVVTGATVTPANGHATLDRWDLVTVPTTGTPTVTAGTEAAVPAYPAIPVGSVVLAAVYVPATATTLALTNVVDKRITLPDTRIFDVEAFGATGTGVVDSGTSTGTNSTTTLNDTGKAWGIDAWNTGYVVAITGGTGAGQVRDITDTTATQLTIGVAWSPTPDATSTYHIARDDLAAIQATIDAAEAIGGGTVWFPRSTNYYVSATAVNDVGGVLFDGVNGATIHGAFKNADSNAPTLRDPLLQITGTRTQAVTTVATAANITQGQTTLTLASTSGISAGDHLVIWSNGERFAPDTARTDYKGERVRVHSVDSGTVVTLTGPTYDSYLTSANTVTVDKYNLISGNVVRNLRFLGIGPSTTTGTGTIHQVGVQFRFTEGARAENVKIEKVEYIGIAVDLSHRVIVTNCDVRDVLEAGLGYGILSYGSDEVVFGNNAIRNCRHAMDADGVGGLPVSRMVIMADNLVADTWSAGCSTHGMSDYVLISGNRIMRCGGGVIVRGQNVNILGNTIYGWRDTTQSSQGGIYVGVNQANELATGRSGTGLIVADNLIDLRNATTALGGYGLQILGPLQDAKITGNIIRGVRDQGMWIRSYTIRDTEITGNTIDGAVMAGTFASTRCNGIWIQPVTHATGRNQKNLVIADNLIQHVLYNGIQIEGNDTNADPSDNIRVVGNTIRDYGGRGINIGFRGTSGGTTYFKNITISDNAFPDALNYIGTSGGTVATNSGSAIQLDSPGTGFANVVSGLAIADNLVAGKRYGVVFPGSAAPTAGTWQQGDVFINTLPASLGALYWVCTAAGTPGTWEAIPIGGEGIVAHGTVGGSTTEAAVVAKTAATSIWEVGKTFRVTVIGLYGTFTSGTLTIRLRIGTATAGTILFDSGAITPTASLTNRGWRLDALFTVRSLATLATATLNGQGTLILHTAATTAVLYDLENTTAATTVDLSASRDINVTAQWSSNNAANTISAVVAAIEPIN